MDFEQERRWWNRQAKAFDTIYSGRKNPFSAALDRLFRWDMEARRDFARTYAAPAPGRHILDVACGTGRFALDCAKEGACVTGVDLSEEMLQLARALAEEQHISGCTFLRGNFLDISFDQSFDAVTALGLFDYLEQPLPFLAKMLRLSRGPVIATFPRKGTPRALLRSLRLRLKGCPVFFYSPRDIENLGSQTGSVIALRREIGQLHCVVFTKALSPALEEQPQ